MIKRFRWVAWWIVLMAMFPTPPFTHSQSLSMARPRQISDVVLTHPNGNTFMGAYVGHGFVLTNAANIIPEHLLWNAPASQTAQLRHILFTYLDDGQANPWEEPLDWWLCPSGNGFDMGLELVSADEALKRPAEANCSAYNYASQMTINDVPIERLVYLNRATDVALLRIDEVQLVEAIPELVPARLDARLLLSGEALVSQNLFGTVANPLPVAGIPYYQQMKQLSPLVARVPVIELTTVPAVVGANTDVPRGLPFYSAEGLAGLAWWDIQHPNKMIPMSRIANELWTVQDQLQDADLRQILEEALWPEVQLGSSSIGDVLAPNLGNSGIDVTHYDLTLDVRTEKPFIEGVAVLSIRATLHHLSGFSLDLTQGMEISSIVLGDQAIKYRHEKAKVFVNLPHPLDYGESIDLIITYRGEPKSTITPYSTFFTVGLEYNAHLQSLTFANEPDGAHTWFPTNDHPQDRATFSFHLTVPDGMTGVANGQPVGTTHGVAHWEMAFPMAPYLATIAVGNYTLLQSRLSEDIPFYNYVYRGTAHEVGPIITSIDQIFPLMEDWYGPYPYASYGQVVTPIQDGALETQTMTILPRNLVQGGDISFPMPILVHELAHQWVGNAVTLGNWSDIWLNEGFATYTEWLTMEANGGDPYGNTMEEVQASVERNLSNSRRHTPLQFPEPAELFETDSYDKGAYVLHMLRQTVGDDAFFEIIYRWAQEYQTRPATTLDFFQLAELVSGQDLTTFRHNWLELPEMPRAGVLWDYADGQLQVLVCNESKSDYRVQVPIRILSTESDQTLDLIISPEDPTLLTVPLDFEPSEIRIDPDQIILENITAIRSQDKLVCKTSLEESGIDY